MSHTSAEDAPEPAPRAESLARISAMAASLRAHAVPPPDPFVWTHRDKSRWWAFGRFGRYTVTVPQRFGWAVGDYPWEGAVKHGRDTLASEVFVKPTYVDAEGRILPRDAHRASPADNHLLTEAMCAEIAGRMERIVAEYVPPEQPEPADHQNNS